MPLINDVKRVCDRLAPLGWRDQLLQVTSNVLDIGQPTAAQLKAVLTTPMPRIDRTVAGFQDFAPDSPVQGLMPGSFARSLLYHALASPLVHPTPPGGGVAPTTSYPTLEELDVIENCIHALAPFNLAGFLAENPKAVIAVFACQYRAGARAAHRRYADMTYSRTGVARVGTIPPIYDARARSWRLNNGGGDTSLAAMPARYAAFLAVRRRPGSRDAVLEAEPVDLRMRYLWPARKIFPGRECFSDAGVNVALTFREYHRNEKLRRVHTAGGVPALPIFDLDAPPFFRDSVNEAGLVGMERVGASLVLVPRSGPLVRSAQQRLASGALATARFAVPPLQRDAKGDPVNRLADTSMAIPAADDGDFRAAPEYLNIRHEFVAEGASLRDLKSLAGRLFLEKLDAGGYEAGHFVDDSADGAVLARISGIKNAIPAGGQLPAFSLVTAPDFFPNADQVAIARWASSVVRHFRAGGPRPLSANQMDAAANLEMLRPGTKQKAFAADDRTMTHVASAMEFPNTLLEPALPDQAADGSVSWLPDAASDVFAPGWDVSLSRSGNSPFYLTSYGLGSPFPEDAKLCAALNSFWPAVAPDASRTFGWLPTGIPLLDTELGLHPQHPAVATGAVSSRGWDGEFGPFFETIGGARVINHADIARSDYVSNALAGTIHTAGLEKVNAQEMIARMETLRACIRRLPPTRDSVSNSRLFLVHVEKISDWTVRRDRLAPQLSGPGYLFVFAASGDSDATPDPADETRLHQPVALSDGQPLIYTCHLSVAGSKPTLLVWRAEDGVINSKTKP